MTTQERKETLMKDGDLWKAMSNELGRAIMESKTYEEQLLCQGKILRRYFLGEDE